MFRFSLRKPGIVLAALAMAVCLGMGVAKACDDDAYPPAAKTLAPITVLQKGETRSIYLTDVYDHHGGVCAGATLAFRAVQHGMDLLFGQQTPDLDDVVILTLAPGGPMDLLDLIVRGTGPGSRTWPPPGIAGGTDKFVFQFMRKSTMQMVTLRLNTELWPEDWFILRAKTKEGTISEAESAKRSRDRQGMLDNFTRLKAAELFGEAEVAHFVAWGAIVPGEIDRHIRDMRRQARAGDSGEL
ncbi:hypothetical protein [Desulfatitalea alkaliphila]|uniref:Formylmethanofuran dehydrogenase subunit E domain-containing protein n=1 Tax=Desulfatitalea alkaliphila TaxID=2929485 RepID=A0AA41R5X1_9BACT|nr:hypothetical protein [Desulfatitalea alkaliphila]MCJ8499763.1 hypothetical protein [Desulfatitalea alkaliphila]